MRQDSESPRSVFESLAVFYGKNWVARSCDKPCNAGNAEYRRPTQCYPR